jgi:hypothetical protein
VVGTEEKTVRLRLYRDEVGNSSGWIVGLFVWIYPLHVSCASFPFVASWVGGVAILGIRICSLIAAAGVAINYYMSDSELISEILDLYILYRYLGRYISGRVISFT